MKTAHPCRPRTRAWSRSARRFRCNTAAEWPRRNLDFIAIRSALSLGCLLTVKGFGTLPSSQSFQKLPRGRGGPVPGPLLRRSPRGFADATAICGVTVQALEDTREHLGVFGFTHDETVDTVLD